MAMITTKNKLHYIESFDSIRGFAILLVLLMKASYSILPGGWVGVDLFFVLSGYLITSLLQHEYLASGTVSLSNFYARRALRLLPPLLIFIILANILWPYTELVPGGNQLVATLGVIFYFTNFLVDAVTGNMSHLWSLSVEEHFYFFWPILLISFIFKMPVRNRIVFLVTLILSVGILRIIVYNFEEYLKYGMFQINSYLFTFCRMDSILMGALLSLMLSESKFKDVSEENRSKSTPLIVMLLGAFILILLTISASNPYWRNGGFVLSNLLCASTVFIAVKNPHHYLFTNKILLWIGKRSYGIYVYHFPIFLAFEEFREHDNYINFFLVTLLRIAATIGLAALSYEFIERPVLAYKKRYEVRQLAPAN